MGARETAGNKGREIKRERGGQTLVQKETGQTQENASNRMAKKYEADNINAGRVARNTGTAEQYIRDGWQYIFDASSNLNQALNQLSHEC